MNVSGKLESHIFRRLVLVYSIQYLALSLTGMVDCSIGGWFCGADGLAAKKGWYGMESWTRTVA